MMRLLTLCALLIIPMLLGPAAPPAAAQGMDELISRSRVAALTADDIGGDWTFKQEDSQVVIEGVLGYYGSFYERDPLDSLRGGGPLFFANGVFTSNETLTPPFFTVIRDGFLQGFASGFQGPEGSLVSVDGPEVGSSTSWFTSETTDGAASFHGVLFSIDTSIGFVIVGGFASIVDQSHALPYAQRLATRLGQ